MIASIEIEDLRVEGAGTRIEGVSLSVAPGERVAVVGPHQPSLSLLIRACAGFEPIVAGSARVCGIDVGRADRDALLRLRQHLGYVSIGGGLLANMTMRDNLELALRYRGVAPNDASAKVEAAIARAGLAEAAGVRACLAPAELAKCFAYLRAMLLDPAVFLAEDPSAFLHPEGRRLVADLHARAQSRGLTVLVADDDVEFVAPLVDRVVAIAGGAS